MTCPKCNGTFYLLYTKDAPSPPYKQGVKLDYATRCDACYEPKKTNQDYEH